MHRLVFLTGDQQGQHVELASDRILLVPRDDGDLILTPTEDASSPSVMVRTAAGWRIETTRDVPVKVNDVAVQGQTLQDGDEIDVAGSRFLFQVPHVGTVSARRRTDFFQVGAAALVALIFAVQLLIIIGLLVFPRLDPIPDPVPTIAPSFRSPALDHWVLEQFLYAPAPAPDAAWRWVPESIFGAVDGDTAYPLVERSLERGATNGFVFEEE